VELRPEICCLAQESQATVTMGRAALSVWPGRALSGPGMAEVLTKLASRMEEPAVVYRADRAEAAEVAKEYRAAIRGAVIELVPVEVAQELDWTTSFYPSVTDVEPLKGLSVANLSRVPARIKEFIFKDDRAVTEFEQGDGLVPAVRREGEERASLFTPAELAAIFDSQIGPAQLRPSSRTGYWNSWRQVIIFGFAHEIMDKILPMAVSELKAFTLELLMTGSSANSIKNAWSAIEHRHRLAGLDPPLAPSLAFTRLFKAVASIKGTPGRLQFPIGSHHVQRFLNLVGLSKLELRSVLVTVLGTVGCCRVENVANLQMCDLLWELDAAFHDSLAGGLAIRIYRRKQDTGRFGLYIRIPAGALVEWLRRFVGSLELRVSDECSKKVNSGARCPVCDPVFPRTVVGRTGEARNCARQLQPMSRQQVSGAVKTAIALLGVDDRHYSGISMRRGGITAAVQARVPEPILYLQSGHGTAKAGRRYVDPDDPRILYMTGRAILGTGPW